MYSLPEHVVAQKTGYVSVQLPTQILCLVACPLSPENAEK